MYFIIIILIFVPLISFANVTVKSYQIQFDQDVVQINEIFPLHVNLQVHVDKSSPDHLSLFYPKVLTLDEMELVNVKLHHSTNNIILDTNKLNQNPIHIKMTFFFKAKKMGIYKTPNLFIAFKNSHPFFTVPKQKIKIIRSWYDLLKYYLLGIISIIAVLFIIIWFLFSPPKSYRYFLEIKTYRSLHKLIKNNDFTQEKIIRLITQYINLKTKSHFSTHQIISLSMSNIKNNTRTLLTRIIHLSSKKVISSDELELLDETLKTFLYTNILSKELI